MNKGMTVTTIAGIWASLVIATCWTPGPAIARSESASPYANGVYTATGQYGGQPSSITVTLTLAEGVVTAVSVTPHATNPTSLDFQRRFAAAVPGVVVGRPIDAVKVDRLAGSSVTPDGFNAAIQRIKQQASK